MPQIDRLIAVLASNRADGIRIVQDEPARLRAGESDQPVTRQALSAGQLVALLREVAPSEAADRLQRGEPADFEYTYGTDVFVATASYRGGRLVVDVVPRTPFRSGNGNGAGKSGRHAAVDGAVPAREPAASDTEAVDAMNRLLRFQAEQKASDLHLRSGSHPVVRVDGDVVPMSELDVLVPDRLERMLRAIMPERNRHEFQETNDTDLAYELENAGRFRVNVFRDRHGIGAVIRAIPSRIVSAEELGLSPEVQALCGLSKGLVLVTGPTGSGKSTTLCGLIDLVNRTRRDHVITIEDPIEFVHESKGCLITQRQVGMHTSSFKQALRAALREDPDVVLVGELRDLETVSIAIETAETGHLVFGTLHTSTAPSTIDRIIDQFPADHQEQIRVMLSESLKGVISQTLCRKIGGGRVAAREILLTTPALSNLIREAKTFQITSVMQTSRRLGMVTLNDALLELIESGQVEAKEAYAKAVDKATFAQLLRNRGVDASFLASDGSDDQPTGAARRDAGAGARPAAARPGFRR